MDYTPYKLKHWINPDKMNWKLISLNPRAIDIINDKISWQKLTVNPNAINIISNNLDKINWDLLTLNPNAIHLLKKNQDKIDWYWFSENPCIFDLDYKKIEERINVFKEDLMKKIYHPDKLWYYIEKYNYDIGSDEYIDDEYDN